MPNQVVFPWVVKGRSDAYAARSTPGSASTPAMHAVVEIEPFLRVGVLRSRQRRPHGQEPIRLESDVDCAKVDERANHEPGGNQQHDRGGHLQHDERVAGQAAGRSDSRA